MVTTGDGKVVDADVTADGCVAAVIRTGDGLTLSFDGFTVPLSKEMQFPMVRIPDDRRLLVTDSRTQQSRKNALIIDPYSGRQSELYLGDAIQEIVPFPDNLAVGYFDEAYGNGEELDGLVIFDLNGNRIYHDSFMDCYCACRQSSRHLLYLSYPDFILKQFDIQTHQLTEWQIPEVLNGSSAITSLGNTILFHSTYDDRTGIYKWTPGTQDAERIGEYPGPVRGLTNCRFLSLGEKGCTVVDLRGEVE